MLKTLPNHGEDQAGQKTAGKEGRGVYWVHAKSNISSNSSRVQPSEGITLFHVYNFLYEWNPPLFHGLGILVPDLVHHAGQEVIHNCEQKNIP